MSAALRCTWTATATNISGLIEDAFDMPIREARVSLSTALQYSAPKSRSFRPGARVTFPDE